VFHDQGPKTNALTIPGPKLINKYVVFTERQKNSKSRLREATMAEEEKGFIIKDKRTFSETGESASEEPQQEEKATQEQVPPEAGEEADAGEQFPEVNFATFIFSLSSSALLHFGEIPDPVSGEKTKNLPMAKHTIDILAMLEEKTSGNLTSDEEQLFKNILYDLRMRYIKETE
jgi:hypothetical protein